LKNSQNTLPYHKLCLGLDEKSSIDALLALGIKQFFVGYLTPEWIATYGSQISPNRRYRIKEQFLNLEQLSATVQRIRQADGEVFLALNAPSFNTTTIDDVQAMVTAAKDMAFNGIIAGSLSLLLHLKEIGYDNIVISNLLGCYSAEAVSFFVDQFHPYKVVLPRDLRHEEIANIVQKHPTTRFEVFLFGDHCRLSEANCFVEHGYDSVIKKDLCNYAVDKKIYRSRARPDFKTICLNPHLTADEQMQKLASRRYDLKSLLDALDQAIFLGNIKAIADILDEMEYIDLAWNIQQHSELFYRAINTLKRIDMPKAVQLCQRVEAEKEDVMLDKKQRSYAAFHRVDQKSIADAVNFFSQFENIVSYKIPTRGRDALKRIDDSCHSSGNSACGGCAKGNVA